MKHLKLATISVLILFPWSPPYAIGVVLFRESLNYFEVIGSCWP